MTVHHAPWHTLTVSEVWYCDQAEPDALGLPCRDEDGWCTSHAEAADGRHVEFDYDLEHPFDCGNTPERNDCLTADQLDISWDEVDSLASGVYRVRGRLRLPGAVIDGGSNAVLEFEPAVAGGAPC